MLVTSISESAISWNVILDSLALYFSLSLICLSISATKAFLTALSGDPPCSRKLELWKYSRAFTSLLKQKATSALTLYSSRSSLSLPLPSPENVYVSVKPFMSLSSSTYPLMPSGYMNENSSPDSASLRMNSIPLLMTDWRLIISLNVSRGMMISVNTSVSGFQRWMVPVRLNL